MTRFFFLPAMLIVVCVVAFVQARHERREFERHADVDEFISRRG